MKLQLHWQIFIAIFLAWIFYLLLGERSAFVEPLGTIFIRLLKMVIVPLVFLSIATGVAGVGDPKNLGRLGAKTLLYYLSTSLLAIFLGLLLVNAVQPGQTAQLDDSPGFSPENLKR